MHHLVIRVCFHPNGILLSHGFVRRLRSPSPQLSLALIEKQAPILIRAYGRTAYQQHKKPRSLELPFAYTLRASFAAGRAVPMQLCSGLLHRQSGWVFVPHGAYRGRCPHRCYCHGWGV